MLEVADKNNFKIITLPNNLILICSVCSLSMICEIHEIHIYMYIYYIYILHCMYIYIYIYVYVQLNRSIVYNIEHFISEGNSFMV